MDQDRAKKDAEALRYRLIVRLALVRREAEAQGRTDARSFADMLRKEIEALPVAEDPRAAQEKLVEYLPKVRKLQREVGLPDHGMRVYPKWMRFGAWALPVILLVMVLGMIIERRRKKKEIDEASIRALDETEQMRSASES